jgi:GTP-binding protein HflX
MGEETRPLQMHDHYTVDGVAIPRFFVSAKSGEGLAALREYLAHEALQNLPDDLTSYPTSDE